jgi:hypothetical protein
LFFPALAFLRAAGLLRFQLPRQQPDLSPLDLQALAGDLVAVQLQQQPGKAGQGGDLHPQVAIGQHQLEYGFAQGILDGGGQIGEAAAG